MNESILSQVFRVVGCRSSTLGGRSLASGRLTSDMISHLYLFV